MASLEQQRWLRFGWNAARYALGPIGGLVVPWLVVSRSSLGEWGSFQTELIIFQLITHVASWGSKDLLLRSFTSLSGKRRRLVETSSSSRFPVLILGIVLWMVFDKNTEIAMPIAALLMFFSSSYEPLIAWGKHFRTALVADGLGLASNIFYLTYSGELDVEDVFIGLCWNHAVRIGALTSLGWWPIGYDAQDFRFKFHLAGGLPFFLISFSGLLASRIDLYTANALLDRTEVGRYQIVASLFIQFQALAALAVAPMAKDLYRLNVESVSRYTQRMRTWALVGLLPMCAVAWVLFTFLFKFELHWGVYAAACALVWPVYAYVPMMNQLYKHHRERSVMWANFAAAALTCSLTLLLLPKVGITGGLLAAAAGQWLMVAWMKREEHQLHALPRM